MKNKSSTYVIIKNWNLDGSYCSECVPSNEINLIKSELTEQGKQILTFTYNNRLYKSALFNYEKTNMEKS